LKKKIPLSVSWFKDKARYSGIGDMPGVQNMKLKRKDKMTITKSMYKEAASTVGGVVEYNNGLVNSIEKLCSTMLSDTSGSFIRTAVKNASAGELNNMLDTIIRNKAKQTCSQKNNNFVHMLPFLVPEVKMLMNVRDQIINILSATEAAFLHNFTSVYYMDHGYYDYQKFLNYVKEVIAQKTKGELEAKAYADMEAKVRAELLAQMAAQGGAAPMDA
jgi:hypothetical protein